MSVWKFRPRANPEQVNQTQGDFLLSLLQQGVVGKDHEFQSPGETGWMSAAEALYELQVPEASFDSRDAIVSDSIEMLDDDDDDLPMGEPLDESDADEVNVVPSPATRKPRFRMPEDEVPSAPPVSPTPEPTAGSAAPQPTPLPHQGTFDTTAGVGLTDARHRVDARRAPTEVEELEMTPMIDMTFLLLVFFMVASTVSQYANLQLPEARTGDTENPETRVVVILDFPEAVEHDRLKSLSGSKPILLSEARIQIGDHRENVPAEQLSQRLREEFQVQQKHQLILQAHRKMPASVVREVLIMAKQAGAQATLVGVSVER